MDYKAFKSLVDADVRDETSEQQRVWLRNPENVERWAKFLRAIIRDVNGHNEKGMAGVRALPPGPRRDAAEMEFESKNLSRLNYIGHVQEKLNEAEDLLGETFGGAVSDAIEAIEDGRVKDARATLTALEKRLYPHLETVDV